MKKIEAFHRISCGTKITKGKGVCPRWLGDIDTTTPGAKARYYCRDCKTTHIVEVVSRGVIVRTKAPTHANLEYDPTVMVLS